MSTVVGSTAELRAEAEMLRGRIETLGAQIKALRIDLDKAMAERDDMSSRVRTIDHEVGRRTAPKPVPAVSDHALLRYIERVVGVDLDTLRREILSQTIVDAIDAGAKSAIVDGVVYRIAGGQVITVVVPDKPAKRKMPRYREDDEHDEVRI